jgi:ribosomal protein L11 methylase PrmA
MGAPTLVLSGLLVEEVDDFAGSLPPDLRVSEIWTSGEWAALVLAK